MRELPDSKRRSGPSFFTPTRDSTPLGGGMRIDMGEAARRSTAPSEERGDATEAPSEPEPTGLFAHAMAAGTGATIQKRAKAQGAQGGEAAGGPTQAEDGAEAKKPNRRPTKKRSQPPEPVAKSIGDHLARADAAEFADLFKGRNIVGRRDTADTFAVMADDGLMVAVTKDPAGQPYVTEGLRVLMARAA